MIHHSPPGLAENDGQTFHDPDPFGGTKQDHRSVGLVRRWYISTLTVASW